MDLGGDLHVSPPSHHLRRCTFNCVCIFSEEKHNRLLAVSLLRTVCGPAFPSAMELFDNHCNFCKFVHFGTDDTEMWPDARVWVVFDMRSVNWEAANARHWERGGPPLKKTWRVIGQNLLPITFNMDQSDSFSTWRTRC